MGTTIRSKISDKNKYWISQHRYYELKHFCMQYEEWKEEYAQLSDISVKAVNTEIEPVDSGTTSDPVSALAVRLAKLDNYIQLVERCLSATDPEVYEWLKLGVTKGCPYEYLNTRKGLLYSRQKYYEMYRKFFWILDKER